MSALENGRRPIDVGELLVIARALEVSVSRLLEPVQADGSPRAARGRLRLGDENDRGAMTVGDIMRLAGPTASERDAALAGRVRKLIQLEGSAVGVAQVTGHLDVIAVSKHDPAELKDLDAEKLRAIRKKRGK